jgi:hypothetical protein
MTQSDVEHLIRRRHLKIQRQTDIADQALNIVVGDMPAVLTQMRRNTVGAGVRCHACGPYGIRMPAPPRIADGGDVIDIHPKSEISHGSLLVSNQLCQAFK